MAQSIAQALAAMESRLRAAITKIQLTPGPRGGAGAAGATGATGPAGDDGQGVPTGGTTAQILRKASNTDFDTEWDDEAVGVSFATPAVALGSAAAAGAASTVIRSDATLAAFDATAPATQAFDDAASVGAAAFAARRDHKHGMPAGAPTSYTPTWTADTVNPAIGNGTITGRYLQFGNLLWVNITIVPGSTTTFGTGGWIFTLPVNAAADAVLAATFMDANGNGGYDKPWIGAGRIKTSEFAGKIRAVVAESGDHYVISTQPFTWASGDKLQITGWYEV